jgi:hypothetical protein
MKWLRNLVWIEKFENNLKKVNKSIERIENGMYDSIKRRKMTYITLKANQLQDQMILNKSKYMNSCSS